MSVNDFNWVQLSANMGYARDGVHAAYLNGNHYLWGGWTAGSTTFNTQYSSTDGAIWNLEADAPWTPRHTCAYCKVGNEIYMVNGDVFNFGNDGVLATASWKFDGTTWTEISPDNGLGGYSLGALVYLAGTFYFVGGQLTTSEATVRPEIWKSVDNCATFIKIADAPFKEGLTVGNTCVFNNKIFKVGGTRYSNTLELRTYPRKIYSSTDGVNWSLVGKMPYAMRGRHYSQMLSYGGYMWLIGGYHGFRGLLNIQEVWGSADGITWEKQNTPAWVGRHACTIWEGPDGLYMGWGTSDGGLKGDIWKMSL